LYFVSGKAPSEHFERRERRLLNAVSFISVLYSIYCLSCTCCMNNILPFYLFAEGSLLVAYVLSICCHSACDVCECVCLSMCLQHVPACGICNPVFALIRNDLATCISLHFFTIHILASPAGSYNPGQTASNCHSYPWPGPLIDDFTIPRFKQLIQTIELHMLSEQRWYI
jgi:hypothetical protein